MSLQEIFDFVKDHLIEQGVPCAVIEEDEGLKEVFCRYRGPGGTKCAIGCLIDDENYDPVIEGVGMSNLKVRGCLEQSGVPTDEVTLQLLKQLQVAHDSAANHGLDYLETIKGLLESTASDFKLVYKEA